jgi:hypothetical protein
MTNLFSENEEIPAFAEIALRIGVIRQITIEALAI